MYDTISKKLEGRFEYMQALASELRGIAFHIENTSPAEYGNFGCDHGRERIVDDGGKTRDSDAATLNKVAKLFEDFWGKEQKPSS